MREQPELNLLPVFETVFRHGSVTRAAAQILGCAIKCAGPVSWKNTACA